MSWVLNKGSISYIIIIIITLCKFTICFWNIIFIFLDLSEEIENLQYIASLVYTLAI